MEIVEISSIDISLEQTRYKDAAVERRLLSSITEQDILDPLQVTAGETGHTYLLLDGFKRYRCARKLKLGMLPVNCIGQDAASGILTFIRRDESGGITTIEQAALVETLNRRYGMSIYDIAIHLGRSPSWVSMRLGMLENLSPLIRKKIMTGAFPVRAYMYGLKGFTRVNRISSERLDAFVEAVSGKKLGTRDLITLGQAYFKGGKLIEQLITSGDLRQALQMMKSDSQAEHANFAALSENEKVVISCLKNLVTDMEHFINLSSDVLCLDNCFTKSVTIWTEAVQKRMQPINDILKEFHDRSGSRICSADVIPAGNAEKTDCSNTAS